MRQLIKLLKRALAWALNRQAEQIRKKAREVTKLAERAAADAKASVEAMEASLEQARQVRLEKGKDLVVAIKSNGLCNQEAEFLGFDADLVRNCGKE